MTQSCQRPVMSIGLRVPTMPWPITRSMWRRMRTWVRPCSSLLAATLLHYSSGVWLWLPHMPPIICALTTTLQESSSSWTSKVLPIWWNHITKQPWPIWTHLVPQRWMIRSLKPSATFLNQPNSSISRHGGLSKRWLRPISAKMTRKNWGNR